VGIIKGKKEVTMPELTASGDIFSLSGQGEFQEGIVHGKIGGGARLSFDAEAELCHGVDISLAAEALAEIEGLISMLLPAIRGEGAAFASAGVRASAQLSPNLFDKAGFTAHVEAQVQASVAGSIAIGLDFQTIAQMARQQLSDLAYGIFIAFLNELVIEAGVWGKASFSANAGAHLEVNGTLSSDEDAGFKIEGGAEAGWGGGTGWDFYARLRFIDVKRFYNTAATLISDEAVRAARENLPVDYHGVIDLLDLLLPVVLISAFELGQMSAVEMLRWAEAGAQAEQPFGKAFRLQMQRFIADKCAQAGQLMLSYMVDGITARLQDELSLADSQRTELDTSMSDLIAQLQIGPLDLSSFGLVMSKTVDIVSILVPDEIRSWRRPLTIMWCGLVIGKTIRDTANYTGVSGEISIIGLGAFPANLHVESIPEPPELVREELEWVLETVPVSVRPADAVGYLLAVGVTAILRDLLPDAANILDTLAEKLSTTTTLTPRDIIDAALRGLVGDDLADSQFYIKLRDFAKTSIETRIVDDLLPALRRELNDDDNAALYIDEVIRPSLLLMSGFVFRSLDRVVSAVTRPDAADPFYDTFGHGLSVLVYRIFARNLVVVSDILVHHVVSGLHNGFTQLKATIQGNPQHEMVESGAQLAGMVFPSLANRPADTREAFHELLVELLDAAAAAFGPGVWSDGRRSQMRQLILRLLESVDTGLDHSDGDAVDDFIQQLSECFFIGDQDSLMQLLRLMAEVTGKELEILFNRVIPALEIFWLRLTVPIVADMERAAHALIDEIARLAALAWDAYQAALAEFNRLVEEVQEAAREAADALNRAADALSDEEVRQWMMTMIRNLGLDRAEETARNVPGFDLLSPQGQEAAIVTAQSAFLGFFVTIKPLLEGALAVVGELADDIAGMVRRAASLPDLVESVVSELQSRLKDAVQALGIDFQGHLSIDDIKNAAHDVVNNFGTLRQVLEDALTAIIAKGEAQQARDEAEIEKQNTYQRWQSENDRHQHQLPGPLSIRILSPHGLKCKPADNWIYPREIPVYLRIKGAPQGFVQSNSPRRILLAVNGTAVTINPANWEFDTGSDELVLRYTLTAANSALKDGLNVLECSVVDGIKQRIREKISFVADTGIEAKPGRLEIAGDLSQFDAPGNDHVNTSEEYVTLRNAGDRGLDLGGWKIKDRAYHTFAFPEFRLEAGQVIRIRTGVGSNTDTDLYWGRNQAVWNNRGDAIYVLDHHNTLQAEHVY
jgi:hypothetical protein